jgi:hypothetical protein
MLLCKDVQETRQVPLPIYGWGRDLVGVVFVRTEELAGDISTSSRLFHEYFLQPISTDQSGWPIFYDPDEARNTPVTQRSPGGKL